MALDASKVKYQGAGKDFVKQEILAPGVYPGRLVQIIDFGLQTQRAWEGQTKAPAYQIGLTYELSDEFMKNEDGEELTDKPRWQSETINLFSLESERAKSTQRYLAMDPEKVHGGDFSALLGTPVNISLIVYKGEKGEDKNKVVAIAAMRPKDSDKLPELVNPTRIFSLDEPDIETFNLLPEWAKEKIISNLEYAGSPLENLLGKKDISAPVKKADKEAIKEGAAFEPDAKDDDDVPY